MPNLPNQAVANSPPAKPIDTVRAALEKMKSQFQMVLPKHLTPDRLFRVAMTAIQQTPKLLECDRQSLYSAVMRSAQLGLEPDGILGQAYLIPFNGKVQFIAGYKGLIDLARRSGEVSNIIAKEVCENDEFDVDFSKEIPFVHKPQLHGDRGKVTHFWAMARFKDGGFHWDYMSKEEVIAVRDGSSGWKSAQRFAKRDEEGKVIEINSPWEQHFNEMGKKTVIRRIAKFLPMSVQRAAVYDELADAGKSVAINDYGEIILDESEVVDNDTGEVGKPKSKLDEFGGTPKKSTKKRGEPKAQANHSESSEEVSSSTLDDYLDDIANVTTVEGLDHKFAQAAEQFKDDAAAMAQLTLAKTERKKAFEAPVTDTTQQPEAGKKLFGRPAQSEPAAA